MGIAPGYRLKNIFFWTHLAAGLTAGSIILIMAVTGALMAFEPQIIENVEKNIRKVEVPAGAVRLSLNEISAKAKVKKPDASVTGMMIWNDPSASVMVSFGQEVSFFVNPYNGEILGKYSKIHAFMNFIESVHRRLATQEKGRVVTHLANAFFLFLALSGLYLWWPGKVMKFKSNLKGKARDWNWHNVIGFWCLPMIFVTTLTGLVMSYTWASNLLFRLVGDEPPVQMQKTAATSAASVKAISFETDWNALLEGVNRQVPQWDSIWFRVPKEQGGAYSATIQEPINRSWMRSQMSLDGTGKVLKWEPFSGMNSGRKAHIWVRYLHTGEAFGLLNQFLMFVNACGAVMLVWTGFAMSWRRFFVKAGSVNRVLVSNSEAIVLKN
jgi:uncharacterized iron-regulated membrane protein